MRSKNIRVTSIIFFVLGVCAIWGICSVYSNFDILLQGIDVQNQKITIVENIFIFLLISWFGIEAFVSFIIGFYILLDEFRC